MRKAAIILIVIGIVVIISSNLFISSQPEPLPAPVRDNTTVRQTTSGDVVGFRDRHGARSWQGIAFAAPPVEQARWQAPQPPVPFDDIVEALAPGQICPQFASLLSGAGEDILPGSIAGDEDCLYLNIWSPPNAVDLPVMFWIHGGGNSIGHGGSYNGAALSTQRDVVVVTINYRLGVFGWFSHPALATGNPADDSGNYGTLDVIHALQWVQDNIAQFGGNPHNVTVFGESAGATDTLAMIASPLAGGLFHRAIVQSGGYFPGTLAAAQKPLEQGGHTMSSSELLAGLLVRDGTVADREAAMEFQADMSSRSIREYLYAKRPAQIFALLDGGGFGMVDVPKMFRDGHVLPDLARQEIFGNPENHNMVPVILGTNRDEPALFMARDPRYVTSWFGLIPRLKDPKAYQQIVKYGALAWKERGVDSLAQYMSAAGNPDVYAYRFDWDEEPSQFGFDLGTALGAAHGLEIAFAFGDFDGGLGIDYVYPNNEGQMALANSMTSYWSEFAYNGDPGSGRDGAEVPWLAWGTDGKHSIILDTPADQGIFMDSNVVTPASIKQNLSDEEFDDPALACRIYARNFRGNAFVRSEYEALNSSCAGLDPSEISRL